MSERGRGYGHYNTNNRNNNERQQNDRPQQPAGQPTRDPRVSAARHEASLYILLDERYSAAQPESPALKKQKVRNNQGGGHHHSGSRQGPSHGVTPSGPRHATTGVTPAGQPLQGPVRFWPPSASGTSRHTAPSGAYDIYRESLRPHNNSLDIISLRDKERARTSCPGVCLRHLTSADGCNGSIKQCDGHHDADTRRDRLTRICPELLELGRCTKGGYTDHHCFFHPKVNRSGNQPSSKGSSTIHLDGSLLTTSTSYGSFQSGDSVYDRKVAIKHSELITALLQHQDKYDAMCAAYPGAVNSSLTPIDQCNALFYERYQHRCRVERREGLPRIYRSIPTTVPLADNVWIYESDDPGLPSDVRTAIDEDFPFPFAGYPYGPLHLDPYGPFDTMFAKAHFNTDGSLSFGDYDLLPYGPTRS